MQASRRPGSNHAAHSVSHGFPGNSCRSRTPRTLGWDVAGDGIFEEGTKVRRGHQDGPRSRSSWEEEMRTQTRRGTATRGHREGTASAHPGWRPRGHRPCPPDCGLRPPGRRWGGPLRVSGPVASRGTDAETRPLAGDLEVREGPFGRCSGRRDLTGGSHVPMC